MLNYLPMGVIMDRIQTILINAFQYENTQIPPLANDKAPTWWPHIVREYDPKKWATSPDPDSYPVDGMSEPEHRGSKEVYDWVQDRIMSKLLTTYEKKIIYAFLGRGQLETIRKASKKLKLSEDEAIYLYQKTLFKIKNSLPNHEITIYFSRVI